MLISAINFLIFIIVGIIAIVMVFWTMFACELQFYAPFNLAFLAYDVFLVSDIFVSAFYYRKFKLPKDMSRHEFDLFNFEVIIIISTIINLMYWEVTRDRFLYNLGLPKLWVMLGL